MSISAGSDILASDFVPEPAPYLSFETTTGTTHSLTTVANQRVIVWAKGRTGGSAGSEVVRLKYNGVLKDSSRVGTAAGDETGFALMYTEVPGAATQDITVDISDGSVSDVVIMVCKLLVA